MDKNAIYKNVLNNIKNVIDKSGAPLIKEFLSKRYQAILGKFDTQVKNTTIGPSNFLEKVDWFCSNGDYLSQDFAGFY